LAPPKSGFRVYFVDAADLTHSKVLNTSHTAASLVSPVQELD